MGMSASQARLLSITTRLTNNEFRAQTITNSKLRLADRSQEASAEYMDALNSQKLMFGVFNDNGDRDYTALTANSLLSYGDLKNQYSLVNSSGKILLNGSDIKKYMNAANMTDFLYSYGIAKTDNPKFEEALIDIFGENYSTYFDPNNKHKWTINDAVDYFNSDVATININKISKSDYDGKKEEYTQLLKSAGIPDFVKEFGQFQKLVSILRGMPAYAKEPKLEDYAKTLLKPQCWHDTGIETLRNDSSHETSDLEVAHMEHVLAPFLWQNNVNQTMEININGTIEEITNGTNSSYWGITSGGYAKNGKDADGNTITSLSLDIVDSKKVQSVLSKPENADLQKQLKKLYYQVCLLVNTTAITHPEGYDMSITDGTVSNNGSNTKLDSKEIGKTFLTLMNDLCLAVANDILDAGPNDSRYSDMDKYLKACDEYEYFTTTQFPKWKSQVTEAIAAFEEAIENLPPAEIPDETDSKYQWYKNLWYRMGEGAENPDGSKSTANFQEIDENLINNAEWLEFCFEHGVLTLEQAKFSEEGSATYPGMGTYDWVSTAYTNASDIVSQDDETAIAIAEAKYKKELNEIEAKDKKYDQDLKKLDTEHTALQTEYDSLKEVISKNVERSFKAFS